MRNSPLDSAVVRILHQKTQEPLGAGFLVSSNHIFTCAHVIADALDMTEEILNIPEKLLPLDFPFLPAHPVLKATVRHWYPVKDQPRVGDTEDFVILELTNPLPTEAHPIVVRILENFIDHSVQMRGFPEGKDDGVYVNGKLQGVTATGRIEIQTDLGRGRVAGGFSGAAVWDKKAQAVVGMIVSISRYDGDTLAYMVPAETLLKAWPELNDYKRQLMPYQALKSFSEEESEFFFGRERTVEEISKTLQCQPFVTLIGASGSGKSSLIQAGLIPYFREAEQWLIAYFRPQQQPFKGLAHSLSPFVFPRLNGLERTKRSNELAKEFFEGGLTLSDVTHTIFEDSLFTSKKRLLLIVDQFEELYNLNTPKELQQLFVDCLLEPIQSLPTARKLVDLNHKMTLLLSVRADFFGEAISYNPFAKLLDIYPKKILGTMGTEELRAVIEAPAAKFGVMLEAGLTDLILKELGDEPGSLPLLEFMLTQLWEHQQLQRLTHKAYESVGGVTKALAEYADSIYEQFNKTDQKKLQHIFVQLIAPGKNINDTKQVATREQIGEENWNVVVDLADSRLVVTGYHEEEKLETAEIAHEALIQHWQPLREWINRDREFRLWQERLRFAMNQWEASDQDKEALLRGEALSEAEKWLRDRENDIPQRERTFIELGSKNKKRSQRRWKIGVATFTALAVTVAFVFWGLWKNAEIQQQQAEIRNVESRNQAIRSQFLLKQTELETLLLAVKTAVQSQKINLPTTLKNQVKYNLLRTVYGTHEKNRLISHTSEIEMVRFISDGEELFTRSTDGIIKLWNVMSGEEIPGLSANMAKIIRYTLSHDGKLLALAREDNTIEVLDIVNGDKVSSIRLKEPITYDDSNMHFNFNNNLLALAKSTDATAIIWDVRTGKEVSILKIPNSKKTKILKFTENQLIVAINQNTTNISTQIWNVINNQQVYSLPIYAYDSFLLSHNSLITFSEGEEVGGQTMGGEFTVKFWNLIEAKETGVLPKPVTCFSLNADKTILATGGFDGSIILWSMDDETKNYKEMLTLYGHSDRVNSLSLNPEGTLLASGSGSVYYNDYSVRLWDISDITNTSGFQGHTGHVGRVKFHPESQIFASGSEDRTIKLWNVVSGDEIKTLTGHSEGVINFAFDPSGKILASVGRESDRIKIWDLKTYDEIATLEAHPEGGFSVAFSPDGKFLASSGRKGFKLWDIEDAEHISLIYERDNKYYINNVHFNPDSTILGLTNLSKIELFDIANKVVIKTFGSNYNDMNDFSFSPDGQKLAAVGWNDDIWACILNIWDTKNNEEIFTSQEAGGYNSEVRFDPTGNMLVSCFSGTNAIKIRKTTDLNDIVTLPLWDKKCSSIDISPDGKLLVSGNSDGTTQLWDLDFDSLLLRSCQKLRSYLKTAPNIIEEDSTICNDVLVGF